MYISFKIRLVIRVEAPGNSSVDFKLDFAGEFTFIGHFRTKNEDKNSKIINNIRSTKKFGEFHLDIPLKTEDFAISNKKPEFQRKSGLLILEFILEEKNSCPNTELGQKYFFHLVLGIQISIKIK